MRNNRSTKKTVFILLIIIASIILFGCAGKEKEATEKVEAYLNSFIQQDYETAYEMLSENEKSIVKLEEFKPKKVNPNSDSYLLSLNLMELDKLRTTYKIVETQQTNDDFIFTVELSVPDRTKLYKLYYKGSKTDWSAAAKMIKDLETDENLALTTKAITVTALAVDETYQIDLGFYEKAEKEKVEFEQYKQFLTLHDIKVQTYDFTSNVFVSGMIKNSGNKTLSQIMVTIYFLDKDGDRISERSEAAFIISDTYYLPIKPNYESSFITMLDRSSLSPDWSGKVDVVIDGIELFEGSEAETMLLQEMSLYSLESGQYENLTISKEIKVYSDSAFVSGIVKNNSDITYNTVLLNIFYLDSDGKPIAEDIVGAYVSGDSSGEMPIKPNYEAEFISMIDHEGLLKAWGKQAEIKIAGVVIAQ